MDGIGAVLIFHGPVVGAVNSDEADGAIQGSVYGGWFGWEFGVGDIDLDGCDDIVATEKNDDAGGFGTGYIANSSPVRP
jgi:hypothetical protein